jgi:hypothetical protein
MLHHFRVVAYPIDPEALAHVAIDFHVFLQNIAGLDDRCALMIRLSGCR